jgi:hypothetical protein
VNATDTVAKTAAGADELKTRARGLGQRLRTVLIMADGVQTVEQVRNASAGLGLAPDFLETLVADGLVEIRPRAGSGRSAGVRPSGGAAPTPTSPAPLSRPMPLGGVDIPTGPVSESPASSLGGAEAAPAAPASSEPERFLKARQYLNDKIVDSLKLRGFFFILKLEKCSTRAELAELMPDFEKAITKANGPEVAAVLVARARTLLHQRQEP